MRGKDSAEEVQIVERTASIEEASRGFAENLAALCRVWFEGQTGWVAGTGVVGETGEYCGGGS